MSAENEITKRRGQAKEKIGEVTDDDELRREGKADQTEARVKDGVEKVGDKAKDAVESVRGKRGK